MGGEPPPLQTIFTSQTANAPPLARSFRRRGFAHFLVSPVEGAERRTAPVRIAAP
jgi:hypothetical protein